MKRAARNALFFLFGVGLVALPALSFAAVPDAVTTSLSQAQLDCIDVAVGVISVAFVAFWAKVIKRQLEV